MGLFSDDSDQAAAYDKYKASKSYHEDSITYELLGGALAYEASKEYENYCTNNGRVPDSHAKAKDLLAGISGALLDRDIEIKDLYWVDRKRAQSEIVKHFDEPLRNEFQRTLIVFYDEYGRIIRYTREESEHAAKLANIDSFYIKDRARWYNAEIGESHEWGAPLGPPYGQNCETSEQKSSPQWTTLTYNYSKPQHALQKRTVLIQLELPGS